MTNPKLILRMCVLAVAYCGAFHRAEAKAYTYRNTGRAFTTISGGSGVTPNMYLSVSFKVSAPLGPNFNNSVMPKS
jgi:hypothetical protein